MEKIQFLKKLYIQIGQKKIQLVTGRFVIVYKILNDFDTKQILGATVINP